MENVLLEIQRSYQTLRPSEQRAADFILEHPDQVKGMSLDELAHRCKVSQPTVLRLVKAVGYKGYREFSFALVEELAGKGKEIMPLYGCYLNREDKPGDIPEKIVTAASRTIESNLKSISVASFEKVVEVLTNAPKIDIFSVENSNATASDLETKLLYLGLNCRHFIDSYHQRIAANNMKPGDVAVGITYSGCSRDTVDALRIAKKRGASTVVLTNFRDSVISRYADLLICTSQEQHMYGDAIFSRTSQILVVDMIYLGIIASDYDNYVDRLKKSEDIIKDKAYKREENM
ncbi:MAG: MurR/RpiR family transcriptional regulator [Ruminococcus sp.]|jgi:DNA-binding MurR/RpiR family transcriptional regulator